MKKLLSFALLLLCASCSKEVLKDQPALGYTMMPGYLNVETVLPAIVKDTVINPKLKDFTSMAIDSGKLVTVYKDTLHVPAGVLISEKKAALYTFYKANYEQQQTKINILDTLNWTYYHKALDAEKVYQVQIKLLQQDVKRTWLEKNSIYLGFGFGLITAILTEYTVLHVK
jgi:hypothetical protein